MICAHHRFPRPTCLNSWLRVQPGQVGTGVVGSACANQIAEGLGLLDQRCPEVHATNVPPLRASPSADRQRRPAAQDPGVATAARAGQRGVRDTARRTSAGRPRPRRAPVRRPGRSAAAGERQVLARVVAGDVEAVRVGEHLGIAVGACEVEDDQLAALRPCGPRPRCRRGPAARSAAPATPAAGSPRRRPATARVRRAAWRVGRGARSRMRIPLPSRFTVVSKPAASTRPAVARSSASLSRRAVLAGGDELAHQVVAGGVAQPADVVGQPCR